MMTSVVAAVSLLVEAAPASTAESRALIATNYSAFVSAAYVPKEHKKMIDAPSIISKIASPPGCTTFDVSALELDDVYASGVGEPDENVLDYDGSGSEMMEQAKHQIARRAKRVIAPYRDNNVFPSNSGAYGYDRNGLSASTQYALRGPSSSKITRVPLRWASESMGPSSRLRILCKRGPRTMPTRRFACSSSY